MSKCIDVPLKWYCVNVYAFSLIKISGGSLRAFFGASFSYSM